MTPQRVIKEIMASEGISQYALSSMGRMNRNTIKGVLAENKNMMTDTVYRIVKVLKGELVIGGYVMTDTYDEKQIVRDLIRDSGLSQTALCKAAGYNSRGSIRMILLNKTSIRMDALIRIVSVMGGKVIIRHNGRDYDLRVCESINEGAGEGQFS